MPCRIFRVGVFFDGTGNSKKPDSSKGKMSNVAKLSDMYKQGSFKDTLGRETVSKMLYTNGVGTYDSDIENAVNWIDRKYDKGGGGGGAKRINEMMSQLTVLLDAHPYDKSDPSKFTKREIDVFGFSRGAAMARDFVNTFYKKKTIQEDDKYGDVHFNFIGIYDTVGSFGKPGNPIDLKPKKEYMKYFDEDYLPNGMQLGDEEFGIRDPKGNIKMIIGYANNHEDLAAKITALKEEGWIDVELVTVGSYRGHTAYAIHGKKPVDEFFEPYNFNLANGSAGHVYHLTAHDEIRKNFPLTDTKGVGEENSLIGVHSDIGGGYAPNEVEEFVYPAEWQSKEKALIAAQKIAKELNAKSLLGGWSVIQPVAITYHLDGEMLVRMGSHTVTLYKAKLQKTTNNTLSLVGLHLMYESAIKHNVPLNPVNEEIPAYLQAYYAYAQKVKSSAYGYVETLQGQKIQQGLSHHPARDPAHKNDHKIASVGKYDAVVNDEPEAGNDAGYVDKNGKPVDGRRYPGLADHVERNIYHNNPDEAILPA